jgi:hypothetical protein
VTPESGLADRGRGQLGAGEPMHVLRETGIRERALRGVQELAGQRQRVGHVGRSLGFQVDGRILDRPQRVDRGRLERPGEQ